MIIVNTVRYATTPSTIRTFFEKCHDKPLIISTICEDEGLNNIDDIIEVINNTLY